MSSYLVFRCGCGRHLYAHEESLTRTCPCGRRIKIDKVRVLARADDAREAGEAVRRLQMGDKDLTGFHSAG